MNNINKILSQALNIRPAFFLKENYDRIQNSDHSDNYKKTASIIYRLYTEDYLIELLQCRTQKQCVCALFPQQINKINGAFFYGTDKMAKDFKSAHFFGCSDVYYQIEGIWKYVNDADVNILFLQKIIADLFNYDLDYDE